MNAILDSFHQMVNGFSDAVFLALIKEDRYQLLLQGLGRSLLLTALAALIGVTIGLLLAIAKLQDVNNLSGNRAVIWLRKMIAGFANGYISVVRGTPAVVQLMVIYFIIFGRVFRGVPLPDYIIASIAFGINSGAYVAEIIRAGIESVDKGQMEAARSLGLPYWRAMYRVVLPQAIRTMIPSIINQFIITLKDTSILSVIGFPELVNTAKNVVANTMSAFQVWTIVAVMYLVVITLLSRLAKKVERRLNRGRQ